MRLSELSAEQGYDALARCIAPICNITMDEDATKMIEGMKKTPEESSIKAFARGMMASNNLLKNHKADVFEILAALENQSVEDYKKTHTVLQVIRDLYEMFSEELFPTVFPSASQTETEESSGLLTENTEE